jgi:hypothetical protein
MERQALALRDDLSRLEAIPGKEHRADEMRKEVARLEAEIKQMFADVPHDYKDMPLSLALALCDRLDRLGLDLNQKREGAFEPEFYPIADEFDMLKRLWERGSCIKRPGFMPNIWKYLQSASINGSEPIPLSLIIDACLIGLRGRKGTEDMCVTGKNPAREKWIADVEKTAARLSKLMSQSHAFNGRVRLGTILLGERIGLAPALHDLATHVRSIVDAHDRDFLREKAEQDSDSSRRSYFVAVLWDTLKDWYWSALAASVSREILKELSIDPTRSILGEFGYVIEDRQGHMLKLRRERDGGEKERLVLRTDTGHWFCSTHVNEGDIISFIVHALDHDVAKARVWWERRMKPGKLTQVIVVLAEAALEDPMIGNLQVRRIIDGRRKRKDF